MKAIHISFVILLLSTLLTACVGEPNVNTSTNSDVNSSPNSDVNTLPSIEVVTSTDSDDSSPSNSERTILFTGAGIKGPLAFADVKIFRLDPAFPDAYNKNAPISTTMSNDAAQFEGLSVPANIPPPYVLTIGGNLAVDLNTGKAPVIPTLITLITEDMLAENRPIYATPLTTLAFYMASYGVNSSADEAEFIRVMWNAADLTDLTFSINQNITTRLYETPPIVSNTTLSLAEQEKAVYHRATLEAFAAKVHQLSLSQDNVSTDAILRDLAQDLQSDWVVDGKASGTPITTIDASLMLQDPMNLFIPNTEYRVQETASLMEAERILLGTDRGPTFYTDSISLVYSPNTTSAPTPSPAPTYNTNNPGDLLLHADFDNRPVGHYADNAIREDFQVGMNGYNDPNWYVQDMDIAADPASSGRGNVLRVKRYANQGWGGSGQGGMDFRADFEKHEDVYLAFDMYLAPDHYYTRSNKNPGLITGTILQASHLNYETDPVPEGMLGFRATVSSAGHDAWGRGDGALHTYTYDADIVQHQEFWNTEDPGFWIRDWSNTGANSEFQYNQPRGRWITVEIRVKMNTVTEEGVSGLKDGLQEVWVTDPGLWSGAKKVSSHKHRWRITNSMGVDGLLMYQFYGGDGSHPLNKPPKDQYHYYDNFMVSTSPITH